MLLENRTAVIYGAGGAIGGAVARAFAREGAKVFLSGRRLAVSSRWWSAAQRPRRTKRTSPKTSVRVGSRGAG